MVDRFAVVPAAYVIFLREGETLLQLRQNTGYMDGFWATAAAGHVEAGESVFEAAQRETHEELGVRVEIDELTPLCAMHRTQPGGQQANERVDFFFSCTAWAGTPRIAEPLKAAELRWFPMDSLPSNVVHHELLVLEALRSGTLASIVTAGF